MSRRWREALLAAGLFALLGGLLAILGCSKEDVSGRLSCVVYDDEVACDPQGCVAPDGGVVTAVAVTATQVVISTEASRFQPDGVYVYAEFAAPESALGVLELDVPRGGAAEPAVAYGEWRGAEEVFHATRTAGTVELAPPGDQRGRFLLRLDDPGPDGALGTPDDLTRVLAAGEYGATDTAALGGEPFATPPPPGDGDSGGVLIDVIDAVLDGIEETPVDDTGTGEDEGGCGGEDVADSDSGCDGSASDSDGSGCEGGGDDAGGCEGDVGGGGCDGGGGGGCEGADLGDSGCEGDYARTGRAKTTGTGSRPHARGPQRLAPLFALGVFGLWCRGGRRRRDR